jgi:hypothetical protein
VGVAIRSIPAADGDRVLSAWISDPASIRGDAAELALAVRYGLQLIRQKAPGSSVELRVPPFGAAQIIEGPRHTRGTPPAVIEVSAEVWLDLVVGQTDFSEAQRDGDVSASGVRADLQGFLPLWPLS